MFSDLETDGTQLGAALGRIPSGCSILTVTHGGRSTGVLVSWVQQASFSPPALTVCIKQGRPAAQPMEGARKFLLNLLGAGENATAMFRHFGKGFGLDENAFAGLDTEPTEFGPLLSACVAHLGCRVLQTLPIGDHMLYAAEVQWGRVTRDDPPYTHIRKTGLSY